MLENTGVVCPGLCLAHTAELHYILPLWLLKAKTVDFFSALSQNQNKQLDSNLWKTYPDGMCLHYIVKELKNIGSSSPWSIVVRPLAGST